MIDATKLREYLANRVTTYCDLSMNAHRDKEDTTKIDLVRDAYVDIFNKLDELEKTGDIVWRTPLVTTKNSQ